MFLDGLTNNICPQLLQLLGCENGQFVVISLTTEMLTNLPAGKICK